MSRRRPRRQGNRRGRRFYKIFAEVSDLEFVILSASKIYLLSNAKFSLVQDDRNAFLH